MSKHDLVRFTNCRILKNHEILKEDLWIRKGVIVDEEDLFYREKIRAKVTHDMGRKILAPGFLDLQINGGYGVDFTNCSDINEGISTVAKGVLANGVTGFCPTIVTTNSERYRDVLPKIRRIKGLRQATVLGVHLEGPFISADRRGAHPLDNIQEFENGQGSLFDVYGHLDNVAIITLASEKRRAHEAIDYLNSTDILVSLGHSSASFDEGLQAIHRGVTSISRLFDGLIPFNHRDPGLFGLISEGKLHQIYYGLIADRVHVHPNSIKIAYKINPRGAILITDAISAMGKPEGTHAIGDERIDIRGNAAYISGTDTLCGSVAKMNECVRFFKEATGCSTPLALEAASLHPAEAIGIESYKGTLGVGTDADFVCLDDNFNVYSTWIAGEVVYKSS